MRNAKKIIAELSNNCAHYKDTTFSVYAGEGDLLNDVAINVSADQAVSAVARELLLVTNNIKVIPDGYDTILHLRS